MKILQYKCDGIGAVVNGEKSIGEKAKSPRTKDVIWTILIQVTFPDFFIFTSKSARAWNSSNSDCK